jgi:ubiquinone/menaquinone biosynthesis C-methylase UbiE
LIFGGRGLSDHNRDAALENAEMGGVRDGVQIEVGDAIKLPSSDGSLDYIVSNVCLHNISFFRRTLDPLR